MDDFVKKTASYREEIFQETAVQMKTTPQVVEKDFWVTWVLGKLFSNEALASLLTFKGGTSLSKVYGLIERFSEDIDLVLNWSVLANFDPALNLSRTQQDKLNHDLLEKARNYLRQDLLPILREEILQSCEVAVDEADPHSLLITYPSSFPSTYLRPQIKLEIGPLASHEPMEWKSIQSYAATEFPDQFTQPECQVKVIRVERTFWEKVTILHREAHRKRGAIPPRYSRHYYDLFWMTNSAEGHSARQNLSLLQAVVEFKNKFYYQGWARYDLARPGTLRLIPPKASMKNLRADYQAMRAMIFGEVPLFEDVMDRLGRLEEEINSLTKA